MLSIIAALSTDGAIGYQLKLLYWLPEDLRRFRLLTSGGTVIMGRRTFESLPNGALPKRRNMVLSRSGATFPGAETFASLEEAIAAAEGDAYVIGGAEVYAAALPLADRLRLTVVDNVPEKADAYFPKFEGWREVWREEHAADERHPYAFTFIDYER